MPLATCEFTNTVHSSATPELEDFLGKQGIPWDVDKLIVIGLIAHTCVEATVRFAAEPGYEVTMVKDATAVYGDEEMHAALNVNIPHYASAVVTTDEIVDSITYRGETVAPPLSWSRRSDSEAGRHAG